MENPYTILECSRFDSIDVIKRKSRKLMFINHPDKNNSGNCDDFVKIKSAYETVLKQKAREGLITRQFQDIAYAIMVLMNVYMSYCLHKPKTIQIDLEVSLDDVISQTIKRIVYKRYVSGRLKRERIYIDLSTFQTAYVFEDLGDENVFTKTFGDVQVNLILSRNSALFEDVEVVDDYNIKTNMRIDLYEYLYGIHISFKEKDIEHVPCVEGEDVIITTLIEDTRLHITFRLKILLDDQGLLQDDVFKNTILEKFHVGTNKVKEVGV